MLYAFTRILILLHIVLSVYAVEQCRFAGQFSTEQIVTNTTARLDFLAAYARMETRFMKQLGTDRITGLTYDGHRLDLEKGKPLGGPHMFSAPSKESIHVALLAQVLVGQNSIINSTYSRMEALDALEHKVAAFEKFGKEFPGFGGFFPWVAYDGKGGVQPTSDWQNRVPALDNGELFWSAFAVSHILKREPFVSIRPGLWRRWETVWQTMVDNCVTIFYAGNGNFRTVSSLSNQSLPVSQNSYSGPASYLNDPYEGELFTVMAYLFSQDLSSAEKEQLWVNKRPQLVAVNLTIASPPAVFTVQRGFWFSSHEQWKYLMLPYTASPTNRWVFRNGETARSWYAAYTKQAPGMWASVTGPVYTDADNTPYYSDCGVGPIASQPVTHDDVITPYSTFPMFLVHPAHAAAWLHNTLLAPKAQSCFGSICSLNLTGAAVAPVTTWDAKITTLLAIGGGIADINAEILRSLGLLEQFVAMVEREWSRVFPLPLAGQKLSPALPRSTVPRRLTDFSTCTTSSTSC